MPQATIIVDDVRYVCGSVLTKALIRWLLDNYAGLKGSGQFVFDYGADGVTPHHTENYPKVRIAA